MRDIHFGNSKKDLNLCNPSSNFYRVDDIAKIKANLNSNTTSFDLSSKTPDAVKDITMQITLLANETINIYWTFKDDSQKPFEVPLDIVNATRTNPHDKFGNLGEHVEVDQEENGSFTLSVNNKAGVKVLTLNGAILHKYLNY